MTAFRRPKFLVAFSASLIAMAMVAACSSSGGNTGSSSTGSSTSSGATSGSVAASGTASSGCTPASGPTVKIQALMEEAAALNIAQPSQRAGIDARVKRINDCGGLGLNHSKLQVDYCTSNYNANTVNACAQKAADDPSVIASGFGGVSEGTPSAIAATANLPFILPYPYGQFLTASNSTTYAIFPGGEQFGPAEFILGCMLGYKKQGYLVVQFPGIDQIVKLINSELKSHGCAPVAKTQIVEQTATDMASPLTSLASGVDSIVVALTQFQMPAAFKAVQQLGIKAPLISNDASVDASTVKTIGPNANGTLVATAGYMPADDSSTPGLRQFKADLAANGSNLYDGTSQTAWIGIDMLAAVTKDLKTVDRASLLAALKTFKGYDAGGQMPTLDLSTPPNPNFPRLFNDKFSPGIIKDGKQVTIVDKGLDKFIPIVKQS